ncbi:TNF receptor-associated factor 6 [Chiloscyllium plagiosum]|uniref:TNF receptor-associated factor 6 n=1 Tax=Chiloscyllium plagiosum TaxID=36176 RepID=UPI001CB8321F|nr:TNF receptor-associated factor 6 [Chiloscyllium plagiosum]XP_043562161.1 TNF receptor-associated factor 6 [Chiloscyllium plagiosum]XP_043562162.1 TNF receptor-associated factor 6 [Chiloscyllium plagiosum]
MVDCDSGRDSTFQSSCCTVSSGTMDDCSNHGQYSQSVYEEMQGYDVEFDPPLENKYECPICLMALREAVQTPCGHRFCRGCIVKSIRDAGHKCPVDNEMLTEAQLFPDNFAKREILSLIVKCPNKGCYQKMELRHLEEHQEQCEYTFVDCHQCDALLWRKELQEHMESDCPKRRVACENCAMLMAFQDKKGHDQNCPLANVTCEYCNMELIREQMQNHYNLDCPKAPVPCTFSAFGCPEKMQRNDLAMHLQDYTQAHMRMMAQTLRSVSIGLSSHVPSIDILNSEDDFQPVTLPGSLQASHSQSSPALGVSPSCDCSPLIQNLRETVQQLEGRLVRQDHQIRELTAKMETQSGQVGDLKRSARALEQRVRELEAQQCNGIFIWRVENFANHLQAQAEDQPVVLHSPGFYTGKPGYKLCLRLHLQSPSAQRCSNYISLFVHTMQGEYDSYLSWPFQGTIRLSILDQSEGPIRQNYEEIMESKPELLAFQRPTQCRNPKGFGYVTFLHLKALQQRTYVKDDMLLVRCEVMTRSDLNWMRKDDFQARSAEGGL